MLLLIGENAVIGTIFEELETDHRIDDVYVSTNEKFAADFEEYIAEYPYNKPQLSIEGHCLVPNLLGWRSSVECLIGSFVVIVVSEPPEPALSAGPTAPPKRVKAVDSHGGGVKPFFDVVSVSVVELTAQFTTCEGSQIARSIDEKLCVGDIVFLGEAVEKRRRGVCPAAAVDINF